MAVEAGPLANFDKKTAEQQNKLAALNKLNGAIGVFQSSLSGLSSPATFRALSSSVSNKDVFSASASSDAAPGNYRVNVTQLAQAQSLSAKGQASMTALLGGGTPTTLTFQFGTVSGGSFGVAGSAIGAGVASGGIANGALTINGTAIATDGTTRSARQLADAINAKSTATGVTAAAATTSTSATLFGDGASTSFGAVGTAAGATYALSVSGVQIAAQGSDVAAGAGVSAATIDTALTGNNPTTAALAAANITFSGSAANGTLQFFAADGSNITVSELVTGTVTGGIGNSASANTGSSVTATSAVTLTSASATSFVIGGSNPAAAGLTAGNAGSYLGASFALDGTQSSGSVVLDAGSQSLQGIRDAINKAAIGVSASIVSDGSASPYRLVLTSNKTGASSTMKISLSGEAGAAPDAGLASLLGYDPAAAQQLTQTSAAQSALLTVNGIAVTSNGNNVSGAVQGVTLDLAQVGASTVSVTRDTAAVKDAVNAFVKAYNELNKTMKDLTSYDPETKRAGVLVGDTTVRSIQTQLRQQLGQAVGGLGKLTTLSQVGISFQRDGNLAVDSSKLNKAITDNYSDIGGLFAAIGTASDSLVKVSGSSAATKPGNYALNVTSLATQGTLTSAAPLATTTVIGANTTWSVTLNQTDPVTASKIANIALSAGSYSNTELAALLRSAINGNKAFADAGDSVETSVDAGGSLVISSSRYGSVSNIAIGSISGTDPATVFGAATPAAGADVAGTIGGMAAAGSGQTLTGAAGSGVEGLKLDITGGLAGDRGTVSFSQGYAYQLNNLAAALVGKDGLITGRTDGLNVTIKSVAKSRDAFTTRLEAMEKRYRAQFTALDTMLASMQSTSSYLTQQLAALANNT
jgi:flagellar hook-associated protein 2